MKTSSMLTMAIATAATLVLGVVVPSEALAKKGSKRRNARARATRPDRPAARRARRRKPARAARRAAARPARWRRGRFRHVVRHLPWAARPVWVRGQRYFTEAGVFYRPVRGGFKIVPPPLGAFVTALPPYRSVRWVRGRRYLRHGGVWYRRARRRRGFVVVARPV